jgi:allantoicase
MQSFTELVDLASERIGGRALSANDEFFAPKRNLLEAGRGVFIPERFTSRGKWMDGWETRRRRTPGHDWCVIRLGLPGVIRGFDVDTHFFVGNYPERCSIDAQADGDWVELVPESRLNGDSQNLFEVADERVWKLVRLNIYPDGGVARFRVYGEAKPDLAKLRASRFPVDLAAVVNGGQVVSASDMHFGSRHNLIMPGRAKNMGDGWETKRRRGPGYDWAVVRLGAAGVIEKIEVDTNHFKGNYPDSCSIEGCRSVPGEDLAAASWTKILPQTKLKAHDRRLFSKELAARGPFTHARLNIYPDGGVSRLRIYGRVAAA